MGYDSHGRGWAEKIDIEKAKQFLNKFEDYPGLELRLFEEDAEISLAFSCRSWYYEDDFPEEKQEFPGPGVFKDLREVLTTEPAVLAFIDQHCSRYLVLITPRDAAKPYVKVGINYQPKWEDVPEEYIGAVKEFIGE